MATGRIPCNADRLLSYYSNAHNLVPSWRKSKEGAILAEAATISDIYAKPEIYDPWFQNAEDTIARDLRKMSPPIRFDDFADLSELSQLKASKTLELLFRSNIKDPTDVFAMQANQYCTEYLGELEALPITTIEGASITGGGGISRRS